MVVCVFFFSTDNGLLINRRVNVETADADGNWEGRFVGTIINYNKQTKQNTISFDDSMSIALTILLFRAMKFHRRTLNSYKSTIFVQALVPYKSLLLYK